MVSFELGEELRKMFFVTSLALDKEKILSPHAESNLRPSDLRSDALPLSHRHSSVILHTARISNVSSVKFFFKHVLNGVLVSSNCQDLV